ncbi:MAG: tocopherol O-methyltransferase [Akkermansiaceae bacterium]|jgi:tocopherol O-methyltransferase
MSGQIYDDLDHFYREIWGTSLHHGYWKSGKETASEARENLIAKILKHWQPSGHLIDIGCGYGVLAQRLITDFSCSVSACTSSEVQAKAITPSEHLNLLTGDWLTQKIPNQSLDGAIALESASHFSSFEAFLKKTHAVLKTGSRLVISDWFSNHGNHLLPRHLAKVGSLPPWRSLDSFLTEARKQGFTIIVSTDLSPAVARTWSFLFWKSLLLPLYKPSLIPQLITHIIRRPALLWSFPLLRLAYHKKKLSYHLLILTAGNSLSTGSSH